MKSQSHSIPDMPLLKLNQDSLLTSSMDHMTRSTRLTPLLTSSKEMTQVEERKPKTEILTANIPNRSLPDQGSTIQRNDPEIDIEQKMNNDKYDENNSMNDDDKEGSVGQYKEDFLDNEVDDSYNQQNLLNEKPTHNLESQNSREINSESDVDLNILDQEEKAIYQKRKVEIEAHWREMIENCEKDEEKNFDVQEQEIKARYGQKLDHIEDEERESYEKELERRRQLCRQRLLHEEDLERKKLQADLADQIDILKKEMKFQMEKEKKEIDQIRYAISLIIDIHFLTTANFFSFFAK